MGLNGRSENWCDYGKLSPTLPCLLYYAAGDHGYKRVAKNIIWTLNETLIGNGMSDEWQTVSG